MEAEAIKACIEAAPDQERRTTIALSRFGGLRCPSVILALRRDDIDLPAGRMTINATETEHHAGSGIRQCPIFPELRQTLEGARDLAPDGTVYVINRYRNARQNLRTTFEKIIVRAGSKPWPKLFQNLRASRETELLGEYPAKDVASWLGNSLPIAMKHYAMPREESFDRATREGVAQRVAQP